MEVGEWGEKERERERERERESWGEGGSGRRQTGRMSDVLR